jgi:hypothetical protein
MPRNFWFDGKRCRLILHAEIWRTVWCVGLRLPSQRITGGERSPRLAAIADPESCIYSCSAPKGLLDLSVALRLFPGRVVVQVERSTCDQIDTVKVQNSSTSCMRWLVPLLTHILPFFVWIQDLCVHHEHNSSWFSDLRDSFSLLLPEKVGVIQTQYRVIIVTKKSESGVNSQWQRTSNRGIVASHCWTLQSVRTNWSDPIRL